MWTSHLSFAGPWLCFVAILKILSVQCCMTWFSATVSLLVGSDSYQEFHLCPCLPNQQAWPAKWLDSEKPTARKSFVVQDHFDAGTRFRLHKETHAPSSLRPGTNRKHTDLKFFTPPTPPILYMPRGNVALRVISQLHLVWHGSFLEYEMNVTWK